MLDEVEKIAGKLLVPLAVGGGVKSLNDFSQLFHHGADKVVLNTFAIQEDASLINQSSCRDFW